MLRTEPLQLAELPSFSDEAPPARLAVAGGSDRRPPDDDEPRSAEVIRFPRERRSDDKGSGHSEAGREGQDDTPMTPWPDSETPERSAQDGARPEEPLWPSWMAYVLTKYRAPDGGHGGPGVFI